MTAPAAPALPARAEVVVVGGGIIGCSVAYHLGLLGRRDVVVLERDRLTSGSTWHAAGLIVTFGSTSATSTEMRLYTRELYRRLEAETGVATGFSPIGFIELAADADRLEEFRRVAAFNRHRGVDVHEISPSEVAELFPAASTEDAAAGFYVPDDGKANPVDVTMALARGARMMGATILEEVAVTGVLRRGNAVGGVTTPLGDIEADVVVNCAGMWARQLGERHGVTIPLQAAEHYYLMTEEIPGVSRSWPVLEDPSSFAYFREEGGGLLLGLFEPECAPWQLDAVPDDASFLDLPPDWDRMAPYISTAMARVPVTADTGIRKLFCGPESFTPDLKPVVGEAPELRNYFVAAGLNSIGILTGGGLGRVVATWIADGRPDVDVTEMNIDRLHPYQAERGYRAARTTEALGLVYRPHYPFRKMATARNARLSPLHDRLAAAGGYFGEVSGWESPDWYGPPGTSPEPGPLSWRRPDWFGNWEAEHNATRAAVTLMDMSFMSKFTVEGADAGGFLDHLSTAAVDGDDGVITYTQWLNEGGTLEADLTVTKLGDGRFWVIASDTAHRHVATWMERHRPPAGDVTITDATADFAQVNLQGPRSRRVLAELTTTDISDAAYPFRTARHIDIAGCRVLCIRITYVGELGYELYVAADEAGAVYDALVAAGREHGLRHAGLRALSSLRLEKGYRDYGHDIDNTDTIWEAGLGRFASLDRPFLGRDAAAAQNAAGPPRRRLVQVLVTDPEPLLFDAEVVHRDGAAVGYVRAAAYGFTLGGAVGLAMVDATGDVDRRALDSSRWEVDIAGIRYPARVSLAPLYDPRAERVKG